MDTVVTPMQMPNTLPNIPASATQKSGADAPAASPFDAVLAALTQTPDQSQPGGAPNAAMPAGNQTIAQGEFALPAQATGPSPPWPMQTTIAVPSPTASAPAPGSVAILAATTTGQIRFQMPPLDARAPVPAVAADAQPADQPQMSASAQSPASVQSNDETSLQTADTAAAQFSSVATASVAPLADAGQAAKSPPPANPRGRDIHVPGQRRTTQTDATAPDASASLPLSPSPAVPVPPSPGFTDSGAPVAMAGSAPAPVSILDMSGQAATQAIDAITGQLPVPNPATTNPAAGLAQAATRNTPNGNAVKFAAAAAPASNPSGPAPGAGDKPPVAGGAHGSRQAITDAPALTDANTAPADAGTSATQAANPPTNAPGSKPAGTPADSNAAPVARAGEHVPPPVTGQLPAAAPLPGASATPGTAHVSFDASLQSPGGVSNTGGGAHADAPIRLELTTPTTAPGQLADASTAMDALALKIAAKSNAGDSNFLIRLDPAELGRIEVNLNVDAKGNAQASLSADKPQTLDLLQRDSGTLERALRDAGLDLAGGLSFSLKSDTRSNNGREQQSGGRNRALGIAATSAAGPVIPGAAMNFGSYGANTRLDITV